MKNIYPRFFLFAFLSVTISVVATGGGQGYRAPLTAAWAPHFNLLKILFLEHHATPRQQTMMEKLL